MDDDLAVVLRPIEKGDLDRAQRAYGLLSEESRYNRFWGKPQELSPEWAERLTNTDEYGHVAWIALDRDDDAIPGLGGASFWRDEEDPSIAEISFTIGDSWQRRGLATLLFSILYFEGWESGVREFRGYCRLNNTSMAAWWDSIGGTVTSTSHQHELQLALEPPADFINRVAFDLVPSRRRIEVAEWLGDWTRKVALPDVAGE